MEIEIQCVKSWLNCHQCRYRMQIMWMEVIVILLYYNIVNNENIILFTMTRVFSISREYCKLEVY